MSYGEETITETNLLEIRRRHPEHVRVRTFPKQVEATNGADWEWHIVGSLRTLRMRVQAKRLQRNGVLKVRHTVKSSGREQREILIEEAEADDMKPVYCIYCTEPQRTVWTQRQAAPGLRSFQTGCLLADAEDVPDRTTMLDAIEETCWPWHNLFAPEVLMQEEREALAVSVGEFVQFVSSRQARVPLVSFDEKTGRNRRFGMERAHHRRPERRHRTGVRWDRCAEHDRGRPGKAGAGHGDGIGGGAVRRDTAPGPGNSPDDDDGCAGRPGDWRAQRRAGAVDDIRMWRRAEPVAGRCVRETKVVVGAGSRAWSGPGSRCAPREPALIPIVPHVVGDGRARQYGAGKAHAGSRQNVHEVGGEVDGRGPNRRQGFDAQAVLQAFWPFGGSSEMA